MACAVIVETREIQNQPSLFASVSKFCCIEKEQDW